MISLLIAEDDNVSRTILEKYTAKWSFKVFSAQNGEEARDLFKKKRIEIAILDWMMPKLNGIELCREIRQQKTDKYIYIILLTARDNQHDIIEGLSAGADDYIIKPFNVHELKARLNTGKRIINLQNELLKIQRKLQKIAIHDGLTTLYNHSYICGILEEEFSRSLRENTSLGTIMLDVDNFKNINDSYGHQTGDRVLVEIASRIKSNLRPYDKAGRYGGEEFLIVIPGIQPNHIKIIMERLRRSIANRKISTEKNQLKVTISLGGTTNEKRAFATWEDMIKLSDQALYKAKGNNKNCSVMLANFPEKEEMK